jgi:hypothetical protein
MKLEDIGFHPRRKRRPEPDALPTRLPKRARINACQFFTDFIRETHRELLRSQHNNHPWLSHQTKTEGFVESLIFDALWITRAIDRHQLFTIPLINRSQNLFAKVDLTRLIDFIADVQKSDTWPLYPGSTPSISTWLFLDADPVYAALVCGITPAEFGEISDFIRRNCHRIPHFDAAFPITDISFSDDFNEQLQYEKNDMELRFSRASFFCTHGLNTVEAVRWMDLPQQARAFLRSPSSVGRPSSKLRPTSEIMGHIIKGIEYSFEQDVRERTELVFNILRYLELYSSATDDQVRVRIIENAIRDGLINHTNDENVVRAISQIAKLFTPS